MLDGEKWQCANLSCKMLGPLIPCVDIEKASIKTGEVSIYTVCECHG
jgi:hypothetical protein